LNQIPNSLPHRLSTKISAQLASIDYVHGNSSRIAGSVRKVLRYPADSLRVSLTRSVEKLGTQREEALKTRTECDVAHKYFSNLVQKTESQRAMIDAVDLEAGPALR
jgi:mitofusin 2